ncbi:hypothetical protein IMZ48_41190 [Candidatus Bathyarchaeota archaeon]|nr:hypothetical protein [Candidatus Bathyarchaeota archaeon]
MSNAKRSSRIAGRLEQQHREDEEKEEERQREAEAAAERRAEKQRQKMEKERESRLMSRETRLKDRETRRLQYRDDITRLSDESKTEESQKRSSRQLRQEIEQRKEALLELGDGEDWVFDCECGVYGRVDDGTHSVACERCNVWQHSKCLGISVEEAERPEFHFICASCRHQDAKPKLQPQEATGSLEHTPPAAGQPEAHDQSSPTKPSLRDTDVAGGANPLTSPVHLPGGDRQIHSPSHSKLQELGIKPAQSPLSTTSPIFNGTSAPSQGSIIPSNAAHKDEPLLPPPSGGISPVKHAQNIPCETPSATRSFGLDMSSTPTLPPIAQPQDPTPPVKVSPPGSFGQLDMSSAPTLPPMAHPQNPTPPVKVSPPGGAGQLDVSSAPTLPQIAHPQIPPPVKVSPPGGAGQLDVSSAAPTLPPIAHPQNPTPPVKVSPPGGVGQVRLERPNGILPPENGL